ncbi:hypothetical protein QNH10_12720 [Sporosarcina thermotolerans]|uniref:hypothetical protein n=1 Tax=Sporosarcina thermotolerans TaxID=633404 RepID=UPI0024BCF42F|nr:hypothetical protein [Sporosarcina thermotolerans]WHT47135.1 hypothetical protein QNH10_12720 [Sporosarcina thermotolerans]
MDRLTINRYVENYIKKVEQSIQEPIVYRELGKMPLDEAKAFFLLLPLLNGENWSPMLNISAIAVGAVHAAFDIHDRVDLLDASAKNSSLWYYPEIISVESIIVYYHLFLISNLLQRCRK